MNRLLANKGHRRFDIDTTPAIVPGIKKSRLGAANAAAAIQCQSQTFIAPKNAPIVTGNANLKMSASTTAAMAHPTPDVVRYSQTFPRISAKLQRLELQSVPQRPFSLPDVSAAQSRSRSSDFEPARPALEISARPISL
jgi:hypothetical protein